LNMNDYQAFVEAGKIYPQDKGLAYTALGIVGEAGEVLEKSVELCVAASKVAETVKKRIRDGETARTSNAQVLKELGDVLWYVAAAAFEAGSSLEEVARINMDKLSDRRNRDVVHGSGDDR
jgi:NTP pyrophosphatase (non-canonical NTP hydrolase)